MNFFHAFKLFCGYWFFLYFLFSSSFCYYFFSVSIMSTFGSGKYLVIAPVKCNILQDISLFKKGDINKMTIQTIAHFKSAISSSPLVTKQKGRPLTSISKGRRWQKAKYLVFAFAVKDWGIFFKVYHLPGYNAAKCQIEARMRMC